VVKFAALRRIWAAPALALALVAAGGAVPASADTPIPFPLPSMPTSLPGITLSPNALVPAAAPSVDALEATLLSKLNAERAGAGLGALAPQPWASSVAKTHAKEMAAARDIWHNHTGYLDIAKLAIDASLTGENVAEAGTLDEADSLLMNSPPHRANILYPYFNSVGIGVALDAAGYVYVTQDFVTINPAPVAKVAATVTAPTRQRSVPKQPTSVAAPAAPAAPPAAPAAAGLLPELRPLAASPVAATRHAATHSTTMPVVVWAVALAALAGVLHAWFIRGRPARRRPSRTHSGDAGELPGLLDVVLPARGHGPLAGGLQPTGASIKLSQVPIRPTSRLTDNCECCRQRHTAASTES
jgi:uncharacterized protein YkwD